MTKKWNIVAMTVTASLVLALLWQNERERAAESARPSDSLIPGAMAPSALNSGGAADSDVVATEAPVEDVPYQGPADELVQPIQMSMQQYLMQSAYGAFPASLQGSSIPALFVDASGQLRVDKTLSHFFEYFLSAAREEGQAQVQARIEEYLVLALPDTAQAQALALMDRYLDYRSRLKGFVPSELAQNDDNRYLAELEASLEGRRVLRREVLGESVAQAMFDEHERYEHYNLNKVRVQLDDSLSADRRDRELAQLEESLPAHIRDRIRYQREKENVEREIQALKMQGNRDDEIYALRRDFYGETVAKRWAFMEAQSSQWQARVSAFHQSKASILASVMLTEEQKTQQINELRDREFTEEEKLKMAWQSLQASAN